MILAWVLYFVWVVGTIGGLVIFSTSVWKLLGSRRLPGGFRLPGIALELVQTEEQLKSLLGTYYPPDKAEKTLNADQRIFIPAYVLLFATITYSLLRDGSIPYFLGAAVLLCVAGAALFDRLENRRAFAVLRAQDQTTLDHVRRAARTKWALIFVLMALLAVSFAWRGGWFAMVAAIYLTSAGVGTLGLVRPPPLIEWAFALMGLALAVTGVVLIAFAG